MNRIFVTGGASGLGRAIAEAYARRHFHVCIGDVNDPRGEETRESLVRAGAASALYVRCDVTREEDLLAVRERLEKPVSEGGFGGVDIVVNNAGVAQAGAIDEVSLDDWRWVVDINLLGVVRGCKVFTPLFKQQKNGHFVNVASMAGLLDVPCMAAYNATKAAVVSLSETLDNELFDDGIGVTLVCPSFFRTNLAESLRTPDPRLKVTVDKLLARSSITADDIAEDIVRAVEKKTFYLLPHKDGRLAWTLKRTLPRRVYSALLRKQTEKMRPRPKTT
jgi:NAD(P)-dependent dehydrogenase (short-subunit alcohol dehydrogenase family)